MTSRRLWLPDRKLWVPNEGRHVYARPSERGSVGIMAQRMPLKPAGGPSTFLLDNFSGSSGALSGHSPDIGGAWTNNCLSLQIDGSGHCNTTTNLWNYSRNAAVTPVSGIYTVTTTLTSIGNINGVGGPAGRMSTGTNGGLAALAQFSPAFLFLWTFDNACQPSTGNMENIAVSSWSVGDTITAHFTATQAWASAECQVGGHFETAKFSVNAISGELCGLFIFKSSSGASCSFSAYTAVG